MKLQTNSLKTISRTGKTAPRTLGWLKKQDECFESKDFCSLKVIAINSLYSTNLRFHPGRREKLASYVYEQRKSLCKASKQKPDWKLVVQLAKSNSKGDGNISFASKFFHFFVSDDYPIFDTLAQNAVEQCRPDRRTKPYPVFARTIRAYIKLNPALTVQKADRYLWLMGNFYQWIDDLKKPKDADRKRTRRKQNELKRLFHSPNDKARQLLNKLTGCKYQSVKLPSS